MPEPTIVTAITKAASPAVQAAIQSATPNLLKHLSSLTRTATDRLLVSLGVGMSQYLDRSYQQSRHFKSILNPSLPLSVLDNYINVDLRCGDEIITDAEFISNIYKINKCVVSGLAGGGKSMLMRYATLSKFEYPDGTIPLFIELRNLNSFTDKNLLAFIRATSVNENSALTSEQFNLAVKAGAFLLLLDGFDEVNNEYKDDIQKQIIKLSVDFPNCSIIVSSRPDEERFGSWRSFKVYTVEQLKKYQCLALIDKLPYENGVKRRFKKEVNSKLYESHQSFLSSPLLTTIMLLTYESFAEIPDRMHAFYGQAFDTLFQKHDAQKEQYQRKTHTGLKLDDFRACFAAFCAMSYLEENFAFENSDLIRTANGAVKYLLSSSSDISARPTGAQLIDDLKSSVCMLQSDGLKQAFVHRSFQEYFAAVFASNLHPSKVKNILDRYALRAGDQAIAMALDLARETVEQEWVVPNIEAVKANFSRVRGESTGARVSRIFSQLLVHRDTNFLFLSIMDRAILVRAQYSSLYRLYSSKFGNSPLWASIFVIPLEKTATIFNKANTQKIDFENFLILIDDEAFFFEPEINDGASWWLDELEISNYLDRAIKSLEIIKKEISSREIKKRAILDDFL